MPSATTTKPAKAGTKRKSAPEGKVHIKEKKAKTERKEKTEKSSKSAKPKKAPSPSESDLDDSDDGGAPIEEDEDLSEEEEDLPKAEDGLHPDRVKAVVANSDFLQASTQTSY